MAEQKFKKGDVVVANPDAPYGTTTRGWTGIVNSAYVSGRRRYIRVVGTGKYPNHPEFAVEAKHFKLKTMAKATVKTEKYSPKIIVVQGEYFSATYKNKKIRGIVVEDGHGDHLILENAQAGDDRQADDDTSDFPFGVYLEEDALGTEEDLKNAGVSNYVVLKDKRQKAVVDMDKLPILDAGTNSWKVRVSGNKFIFGCGNVELTRAQIEGYLRWRKKYNVPEMNDLGQSDLEDVSKADAMKYYAYKEEIGKRPTGDYKLYQDVVKACEGEIDEEEMRDDIYDETIESLFEYADHINSGV